MSISGNKLLLALYFIAVVLTLSFTPASAADFAAAVDLIAGKGPNAVVAGAFGDMEHSASTACTAPLNIIAWWPGNGNSDDVIGTNEGALQGGTAYADGVISQAFSLDGTDDFINLANPMPDMTTLTITAWTFYRGGSNSGTIFMDADDEGGNDLVLNMSESSIGVRADKNGAGLNYEDGAVTGLDLGNAWHFLAWTMSPTQTKIYVDGILVRTINESGSNIGNHSANPSIGRWWDQNDDKKYFNGLIDEVRFYNEVLSGADIRSIYACSGPNLSMAVANFSSDSVSIFLGNDNGTFQPKNDIALAAGSKPNSIAKGDFNNDGILDLAVANSGTNNISVLPGNGAGGFGAPVQYAAGTTPYSISVGDFNGDGKADLAVANYKSNTVSILVGDGTGAFAPTVPAAIGINGGPVSVIAGDFNGNGSDELAVAGFNTATVSVLELTIIGTTLTTSLTSSISVGRGPIAMITADLNNDGYLDIAAANSNSNSVSILQGRGDSTFEYSYSYSAGNLPSSLSAEYINSDAYLDLVVTNINDKTVSVLYGGSNGKFLSPSKFTVGKQPVEAAAADFTGDGMPDIVAANFASNTVSFLENLWTDVITAPAPGEHIPTSATNIYTVKWNAIAGATKYNLLYSSDNGSTFKTIAKSIAATQYNWKFPMPGTSNMNDNLLKVVGYNGNKVVGQGVSPSVFSIDEVVVTSPNGGESFNEGTAAQTISWTTNTTSRAVTQVRLYYSIDGGTTWISIITITTGNSGTYTGWTVPAVTATERDVLVKVELRDGRGIIGSDISDKLFTILNLP